MIRVFPRRTKWTPEDELAYVGEPPPAMSDTKIDMPIRISVTFLEDRKKAGKLALLWRKLATDVQIGGPAFDAGGGEFVPGRFIKHGVTITSRGWPISCCLVQYALDE